MFKNALFIIAGIVSIGLSVSLFKTDDGHYVREHSYGGDAYTGIQNAAALTGQNVQFLIEATTKGFGSILLVGGLALIAAGVPSNNKSKKSEEVESPATKLALKELENETTE